MGAPELWLRSSLSVGEEKTAYFVIKLGAQDHLCGLSQRPSSISFLASRCSECQESLTNWYYEKDGKLYCHKDYWAKFGEFCHGCSLLMTGPAMVSCPSAPHSPLTTLQGPWSVVTWASER